MPDQQVLPVSSRATAEPMPQWTYDDFCDEKPYAWLMKYKDSAFTLNRMLALAQRQAKEVKFPAFTRMWNAYVAQQKPQNATVIGEYETSFPDQPLKLNCRQYICDENGISYINGMGQSVEVLSHPLMPVKRIINLDTNEEKLQIAYSRGGQEWRTLIASKDVLATSQRITSLAKQGIAVNSENSKELVNFITKVESANYTTLDQQKATGHLGWLPGGGFSPYCDDVVYDGDSPEFQQMFGGFKGVGSEDVWMEIAKATRSGKSVPARIALAASFAAPLVPILNGLPFFVHIWGTQGCGKTVGLMLAASVWSNPEVGRYIKTFNATKVSQELYAAFCCNVPILLDELQIAADRKTFDDIIYMLCEGAGKSRGAKDGGLQLQKRWASTIITTAEMPIVQSNSGGGAAVRTIEVNYGGEPLFEDSRTVAETLKHNYGFAGKKFVESLKEPEAMQALRDIQKRFYSQLSGDIQDKQVLAASILLAADRLADAVLFHDGKALTVHDIKPYLITNEQADVNARCYEWLCGFIASNPMRFEENDNTGELWGEVRTEEGRDTVYFIKSAFDKALAQGGFSVGSFLTWARRRGLLKQLPSRPDKLTVQRRFAGRLTSCVGLTLQSEESSAHDGMTVVDPDDDMPF